MIISDALSRAPVEECMEVSEVGDFIGVTANEKLIVNAVTNNAEKVFGDQNCIVCYKKQMQIKITLHCVMW